MATPPLETRGTGRHSSGSGVTATHRLLPMLLLSLASACADAPDHGRDAGAGGDDAPDLDAAPDIAAEDSGDDADPAYDSGDTGSDIADTGASGTPLPAITGAAEGSGLLDGAAWTDTPFALDEPATPQHPFLAPNPWSNIHNDGAMTDTYAIAGPRGRDPRLRSAGLRGLCGSIAFRSDGLLVTVCIELAAVRLHLIDPTAFTLLASLSLPPRPGGVDFGDFGGGGYFFLDNLDRAVVPTSRREVQVLEATEGAGGWTWRVVATRDPQLSTSDRIVSALPDAAGNLWFVSAAGVAGYFVAPFDTDAGALRSLALGEPIANSFAVDQDGAVYVATEAATYRLVAGPDEPTVVWRTPYQNIGTTKPGQVSAGTGTTPTLFAGDAVAITDNADPMQVLVMRRGTGEVVCTVPVFAAGASATENSLVAAGRSLFVENNFGYERPSLTATGPGSTAGFARVDLRDDRTGCDKVWERSDLAAPSVVAKASRVTGLLYTYTRPRIDETGHDWAFAALSLETGDPVWEIRSGSGPLLNNNYAGLAIGPDEAAYLGTLGGFVRLSDGR